jgi:beta-glucosidase
VSVGASSEDLRLQRGIAIDGETADNKPLSFIMGAAEFERSLGRKVPVRMARPFRRDSTLGELCTTFLGRRLYNVVVKMATKNTNAGEQEGEPLSVMLLAQAPYVTVDALITYTNGKFSEGMLDGLLDFLNGRRLRGMVRVFKQWRSGAN